MRIALPFLLLLGCATDRVHEHPDLPATITLDNLSPGWRVTTTHLGAAGEDPIETTTVSTGHDVVLELPDGDIVASVVTDAAGEVVRTQVMRSVCFGRGSRTLEVPTATYPGIQDALDDAAPGDTVKVAPGTYAVTLEMREGVCLFGSGADMTTLTSEGSSIIRIDGAPGSVIAGFTLRGAPPTTAAACATDPGACAGESYTAAIHVTDGDETPSLVVNNIIVDNDIAILASPGPLLVRNNVIAHNREGFVANHAQSSRAYAGNNVFFAIEDVAIYAQASNMDIVNNVIATSGTAVRYDGTQTGYTHCNRFWDNRAIVSDGGQPERFTFEPQGNSVGDPIFTAPADDDFSLAATSPLRDAGCYAESATDPDGSRQDVGVYGGAFGHWIE